MLSMVRGCYAGLLQHRSISMLNYYLSQKNMENRSEKKKGEKCEKTKKRAKERKGREKNARKRKAKKRHMALTPHLSSQKVRPMS